MKDSLSENTAFSCGRGDKGTFKKYSQIVFSDIDHYLIFTSKNKYNLSR